MRFIATQKYAKTSPQKVREVVSMIKKMSPGDAVERLPFTNKIAAEVLIKTIKSAIASAKERGIDAKELKFAEIQINDGPRLKRGIAVSKGRWHPILKRMSHVRVILESKEVKKQEIAKEVPTQKGKKVTKAKTASKKKVVKEAVKGDKKTK